MGINPMLWGYLQWELLHLMAYTYPNTPTEERQLSMRHYIQGMCPNLPCYGCSFHCSEYIRQYPPTVESKEKLFKYLVDFHNSVNIKLGKRVYTESEVKKNIVDNYSKPVIWTQANRSHQIRQEDHKKIMDMQIQKEKTRREYALKLGILSTVLGCLFISCVLMVLYIVRYKRSIHKKTTSILNMR